MSQKASHSAGQPKESRRIFVICPVRNVPDEVVVKIGTYVKKLERSGAEVYWPFRDTDQNDPIGLHICQDNRRAVSQADEIHIWFDPKSQGSVFDFGMTFAFMMSQKKRIVIANPEEVRSTKGKSFQNVLLALATTA